jgi:hypothetical protein
LKTIYPVSQFVPSQPEAPLNPNETSPPLYVIDASKSKTFKDVMAHQTSLLRGDEVRKMKNLPKIVFLLVKNIRSFISEMSRVRILLYLVFGFVSKSVIGF